MPQINNLSYTDTFKTWFDRTNSVINTLNGVTVYNILAGDGVGVTSSGGLFTISHGSNVATGVTFAGNVNFNGTVSFTTAPTVSSMVVGVTPKITGITAGNVVRVSTNGLTLAKADTAQNAEVLGIVVGENASSNIVAVSGVINNTTFANTIANALQISGGTLSPNQAYFLSPDVAGGITTVEPTAFNTVSKPILLGITGNVGCVLPYRGQLIGLSSGSSSNGGSKRVITIDKSGFDAANLDTTQSVKVGDLVFFFKDSFDGQQQLLQRFGPESSEYTLSFLKWAGKLDGCVYNTCGIYGAQSLGALQEIFTPYDDFILGLVSKVISTSATVLTVEVTQPGGNFDVNTADLDALLWREIFIESSGSYTLPFNSFTFTKYTNLNSNYPKLFDFIKTGPTTANISVYDVSPRSSVDAVTAATGVFNRLATLLENRIVSVNGALNANQYSNTYTYVTGKPQKYINPITDGWYFVTTGITYNNLKITPGLPSQPIKIDKMDYDWSPSKCPNLHYFITGATLISGVCGATGYQNDLKSIMLPSIQNIRKFDAGDFYSGTNLIKLKFNCATGPGYTGTYPGITLQGITVYVDRTYYAGTQHPVGLSGAIALNNWRVLRLYNVPGVDGVERQGPPAIPYAFIPFGTSKEISFTVNDTYYNPSISWYTFDRSGLPSVVYFPSGISQDMQQYRETYYKRNDVWVGTSIWMEPWAEQFGLNIVSLSESLTPYEGKLSGASLAAFDYKTAQRYYLRTYPAGVTTGFPETASLNYTELLLGNLSTQKQYKINFPVKTVIVPTGITLYSPVSGTANEAYNVNASNDMRETAGSLKNLPWSTASTTRTSLTTNNITVAGYNKGAMTVQINDGAESLDSLRFHYVVDATYKDQLEPGS